MSFPEIAVDTIQHKNHDFPKGKIKSKDMEKSIGRKLKLKEKIALSIVNHKLKKHGKKDSNYTGALLLAIGGLLFVTGGILIAFISTGGVALFAILIGLSLVCTLFAWKKTTTIKKDDPDKVKGRIAQVIAAIAIVGLAVVAAVALIALSL